MIVTPINGTRNGVNRAFTLSSAGAGMVLIVWAQHLLKEVPGTPGTYEYARSGLTFTMGSAPAVGEQLYAYTQPDPSLSLTEISLSGIQNGLNQTFRLSQSPPAGQVIFKNGFVLEESLTIPNAIQYQRLGPIVITMGLPPIATDKFRVFMSAPATAVMAAVPFTGAQDSANTRYRLNYQGAAGTEPALLVLHDGVLSARTLAAPAQREYVLVAPNEVVLGLAPLSNQAVEFVLIGSLVVTTSPYSFTQDKLARRVGIFTQRRLDQIEAREVVSQVYQEMIDAYQWSFLHMAGAITTDGLKTAGKVTVTNGSQVVTGVGTTFGTGDVGKTFRLSQANYSYSVLSVDAATQRVQIDSPYADETAANQPYLLYRHIYPLPAGVEYVFSMTSQYALREVPQTIIDYIDPMRTSTADVPQNYAYAGKNETGQTLIELYPIPSSQSVIRFTGIRSDALTDPQQRLKGIDSLILNCASAAACRVIAVKEGEEKRAQTWMALAETYDRKADGLLMRLDSLDLTRSDVAKVQGMRGDATTYDGWYEATHDTWSEDLW